MWREAGHWKMVVGGTELLCNNRQFEKQVGTGTVISLLFFSHLLSLLCSACLPLLTSLPLTAHLHTAAPPPLYSLLFTAHLHLCLPWLVVHQHGVAYVNNQ